MSILLWFVSAVTAYVGYQFYQKLEYARKRADYILDRRRAAGIPDSDKRPFAAARADALIRITEQKQLDNLDTPTNVRNVQPASSVSQIRSDGLASRLSGIPGALPGYLKHTSSQTSLSKNSNGFRSSLSPMQPRAIHRTSYKHPRHVGSPTKFNTKAERSSTKTALKRGLAQVDTDDDEEEPDQPSANKQRALKRRNEPSPSRDSPLRDTSTTDAFLSKVAIPGQFASDGDFTDEEMTDSHDQVSRDGPKSEQSLGDITMSENSDQEMVDVAQSDNERAVLASLRNSARATAKKRGVEEASGPLSAADVDVRPQKDRRHLKASRDDADLRASITQLDGATREYEFLSSSTPRKTSKAKRELDTSEDRKPGDEWVDYEGLHWRIDPLTNELQRLSDVVEWRYKYQMPKDSMHPMAKERHQVIVSKWLTKDRWEEAKSSKLLGYQEADRLLEKERQDKEVQERLKKKQEILAKIRETSSPNKRLNTYLASKQRGSNRLRSADSSMTDDGDRTVASMSSNMSTDSVREAGKPRSRRISLKAANSPTSRASPNGSSYKTLRYSTPSQSASASPLTKATFIQQP